MHQQLWLELRIVHICLGSEGATLADLLRILNVGEQRSGLRGVFYNALARLRRSRQALIARFEGATAPSPPTACA